MPVVLDPVLASGRGDPLAIDETIAGAALELCCRSTTVLTPNSLEARRLARAAQRTSARCALADAGLPLRARHRHARATARRWSTRSTTPAAWCARTAGRACRASYHGSGCTLASALAALLAHGLAVREAVRDAQEYTWQALAGRLPPGARPASAEPLLRARK